MIPCHLFQHKGSLTSSCSTGRPFLWCCHLSVLLPSYCGEVRDHIVCKVQLQQLVLARGVMACVLNTRLRIMYSIFFCKVWPECTIVCHGVKSLPYSDKGSLFMPMFTKCSALHLRSWWIIFVLQVKVIVMSHKCSCILLSTNILYFR